MQRKHQDKQIGKESPSGAGESEDKEETIPEHLECKPCWTSETYFSAGRKSPGPGLEGVFLLREWGSHAAGCWRFTVNPLLCGPLPCVLVTAQGSTVLAASYRSDALEDSGRDDSISPTQIPAAGSREGAPSYRLHFSIRDPSPPRLRKSRDLPDTNRKSRDRSDVATACFRTPGVVWSVSQGSRSLPARGACRHRSEVAVLGGLLCALRGLLGNPSGHCFNDARTRVTEIGKHQHGFAAPSTPCSLWPETSTSVVVLSGGGASRGSSCSANRSGPAGSCELPSRDRRPGSGAEAVL